MSCRSLRSEDSLRSSLSLTPVTHSHVESNLYPCLYILSQPLTHLVDVFAVTVKGKNE